MNKKFLHYEVHQDYLKLISQGEWTLNSVRQIEKKLRLVPYDKKIIWDVSAVDDFDSAGVLLFIEYFDRFKNEVSIEVVGYSKKQKEMHALLSHDIVEVVAPRKVSEFEKIGKTTMEMLFDIRDFITFLGHLFLSFINIFKRPKDFRYKEGSSKL